MMYYFPPPPPPPPTTHDTNCDTNTPCDDNKALLLQINNDKPYYVPGPKRTE